MKKTDCKHQKKRNGITSKQRLVNAAIEIFSKIGFDAGTTREIAEKAGVNNSLIQRYYGGKIGLLLAMFKDFRSSLSETSLAPADASLEKVLETFFEGRLKFAREHRKLIKILLSQGIINPIFRKKISALSDINNEKLVERIRELQSRGLVKANIDCDKIGRFLNILPLSLILLTEVISSVDPEYAEEFVPTAVDLISSGLKKK